MTLIGADGTPIISIDERFKKIVHALLINEEKIHQVAAFCNHLNDRLEKLEKKPSEETTECSV